MLSPALEGFKIASAKGFDEFESIGELFSVPDNANEWSPVGTDVVECILIEPAGS